MVWLLFRSRRRAEPGDVVVGDAIRGARAGRDGVRRGRAIRSRRPGPATRVFPEASAAPHIHVPSPIRFSQTSLALTESCAVGSVMLSEAGSGP